ncbi:MULTISPECIES: type II secretion system F family protein [Actinoalloteichus]|uniref:Type II secretion system protein F n=1 Tax=Actinoalloteichus fjordicus TaxID=1612552 RepID=A0AAC9L9M0_9PSEU|nr:MULTISPECIES: type II secretion system F family protein [Actinoalloteichus]APU12370.1 type II secretion system protein F [Actinoalloteichus fjordicus]APU18322.1 type II secretion system protein F [Actinoalloteichus sp. GBA129-24]
MTLGSILLAAALLAAPGVSGVRGRLAVVSGVDGGGRRKAVTDRHLLLIAMCSVGVSVALLFGGIVGLVAGTAGAVVVWCGGRRVARGAVRAPPDPARLAAGWDVLAAGLRAGLTVPAALHLAAEELIEPTRGVLYRVAELLTSGEDPDTAWQPAVDHPPTRELARGARRTAQSGSALAGLAVRLADSARSAAADALEVRAQRAAVLVTGPLGLCFLPAFLCLGILPVVIGLATGLLESW